MPLKPVLGPVQLVFYSVGVIVGAGVYSVIGTAAGLAQQSLWLSFAVGAGVAVLTAVSYAEMATAYPEAGAEYIYIRRAWPNADWLPFAVGVVILIGGAAAAATVAIAFGGYLRVFVDVPPPWSALALLLACTALNIWGLRESSWANMLFTSIEVGGLLLVIAAGLAARRRPRRRRPRPSLRSWRPRRCCSSSISASRRSPTWSRRCISPPAICRSRCSSASRSPRSCTFWLRSPSFTWSPPRDLAVSEAPLAAADSVGVAPPRKHAERDRPVCHRQHRAHHRSSRRRD